MKLYIKQKVFSFTDRFVVKDEAGEDKYFVEGEMFTMGHKLHIYDKNNIEVGYIRQKLFTFMPRFEITVKGIEVGDLVKKLAFLAQRYYVEGTSIELEGDAFSHEYTLIDEGNPIMTMSKEWFTWGDSYALDIFNEKDEILSLAIVLAVDSEMCTASNSRN